QGLPKISARHVVRPFSWPAGETANKALGQRLVRKAYSIIAVKQGQLTLQHVNQVRELAEKGENGKVLQLPGGVDVPRDDDFLVFLPRARAAQRSQSREFAYPVGLESGEARVTVKEISCVIRFRSIDWPTAQRETIEKGWVALDQHKLRTP